MSNTWDGKMMREAVQWRNRLHKEVAKGSDRCRSKKKETSSVRNRLRFERKRKS